MSLVAISASYGAAGVRIGRAVAERLDVPFLDRLIPATEAAKLEVPEEPPSHGGWLERALRGFVGAESTVSGPIATGFTTDTDAMRRESEAVLHRQAASGRGVILGRAAVVVLREDPRVLRVRLDGPAERRIEQAVRLFHDDREAAADAVRKLDRTHDAYLREYYGTDIHDPSLYHLVVDSTALPIEACVELVLVAAEHLTAAATATSGATRG
jgi:cytidylate kinase